MTSWLMLFFELRQPLLRPNTEKRGQAVQAVEALQLPSAAMCRHAMPCYATLPGRPAKRSISKQLARRASHVITRYHARAT